MFGILWNTYTFIKNFKQEERNKMQLWSLATKELINDNLEVSNLTLEVLKKNERIGRNPKTGEEFLIRGRNVIVFKSSKTFLNKLNK